MDYQESRVYGTSLLKASLILEALANSDVPLGIADISKRTQLNKPTVFKVLSTLQLLQFVSKDEESPQYSLGVGLVKLARKALSQMNIVHVAQQYLVDLNKRTGETVHLGIPDGNQVVYVLKLESTQVVRMYSRVGNSSPLYCTGLGKAILSCLDEDQFVGYVKTTSLVQHTQTTITSAEALTEEMDRIRSQGYAIDDSEHEDDVRCVAAPLYARGRLYGAISISAPRYRMDDRTMEDYIPLVTDAARKIISELP